MDCVLENEFLKVQIKKLGAELCSVFNKATQTEHIWHGDPKVWGRHAPMLFPIVGQVKGGEYEYDGERYNLSQHGFARDMEFTLEEQGANYLRFSLDSTQETKSVYPFDFCLEVCYRLERDELSISYHVNNEGKTDMWFSIGAHPGFNCPFFENESFQDYYLELDREETLDRLCLENGFLDGKMEPNYIHNSSKLPLEHKLFDNDAVIFESLQSSEVVIKSHRHNHFVKVNFQGWPYLGIWSKPKANAPYVCIEPWYGITSSLQEENFTNKKGICRLGSGQQFSCCYAIQIG